VDFPYIPWKQENGGLIMSDGTHKRFSLYGGADPAELPRYSFVEAARATKVPASTIGAWLRGGSFKNARHKVVRFEPVIARPRSSDARLSFNNLLEVNVLRALRQVHEVKLQVVRKAIDCARSDHGIDRLLIHPQLAISGGKLFLDYYFKLVDLSQTQQLAMEDLLRYTLKRVQVDHNRVSSFFPVPRGESYAPDARPLLVSPVIAFGSAVVQRRGITTAAIRERFDVGEPRDTIVADYRLTPEEFDEAILYEAAA
jgi:uncharacterized protein (DUF433 family)